MFKLKKPVTKAPEGILTTPSKKHSDQELKKFDAEYKKSEHYKLMQKRKKK